ncbi:hypothetical protein RQP46_010186 [Phenoliferia psychrophenolica]
MANHGILPRTGRGISYVQMQAEIGFGPFIVNYATLWGLWGCHPAPAIFIDLEKLGKHGILEHNAPGATHWELKAQADAHYAALERARITSPGFVYGPNQIMFTIAEIVIISLALGDPLIGKPRLDWLNIVFREERPKTGPFFDYPQILSEAAIIGAASKNPLDEGFQFVASTVMIIMPAVNCALNLPGYERSSLVDLESLAHNDC